jgi:hypothetical protein
MSVVLVEELNYDHEPLDLAPVAPGAIQLLVDLEASGALTPRALGLPDDIGYDQYESLGAFLGEFKSRINFYLGDWLIFGEGTFAERWSQACEATGLAEQTLLRIMDVCRKVPPGRRNGCVWSIHAGVSSLGAREQRSWLRRALENQWSYAELRNQLRSARHDAEPPLFEDTGPGEPIPDLVVEAARSLIRNAEEAGENVIVRREDFVQLRAALGEE